MTSKDDEVAKQANKPKKSLFARWRKGDRGQVAPAEPDIDEAGDGIKPDQLTESATSIVSGAAAASTRADEDIAHDQDQRDDVLSGSNRVAAPENAPGSGPAVVVDGEEPSRAELPEHSVATPDQRDSAVSGRQPDMGAETNETSEPNETAKPGKPGIFRRALSRTGRGLETLFLGRRKIDAELFEELETQLLLADVGVDVCMAIIDELTDRVKRRELENSDALRAELHQVMGDILLPCQQALDTTSARPFVILVVGVNGVGKTTTIGKLARNFQNQGKSVMLAAGDTFRAAAVEQLQTWGERNNVAVVAQQTGSDSASVIYDAIASAQAREIDVLIADTAGRLHTKSNLMEELAKVKRVMAKLDETAPHEVLLVLDAGTGQNAVQQVDQFREAVGVSGLAVTKLDGTAKGGVVLALCRRFNLPIRYVGLGEGIDDLQVFDAERYVAAMLAEDEPT